MFLTFEFEVKSFHWKLSLNRGLRSEKHFQSCVCNDFPPELSFLQ